MPPNEPPRPRAPSKPEIQAAEVDRTVGGAENQRRFDVPKRNTLTELPAARPPERKPTLTGSPAPPAPRLPFGQTVRRPTPPSAVAAARRSDPPVSFGPPPMGVRVPADETLPSERQADREALLLQELAAERAKSAKLERDARAGAEARVQSFPPPVQPQPNQAPNTPVIVAEPATEAVLEWLIKRAVANRKAIYGIVAALGLGGGGALLKTANEKPAPPALTKADLDAAFDKFRTRKGGTDDLIRAVNDLAQVTKCTRRKVSQIGESVLPAPDHMGSQRKPQPFEDDCPENPKPLPEP